MTINAIAYAITVLQTLAPTLESRLEHAAVKEALQGVCQRFVR